MFIIIYKYILGGISTLTGNNAIHFLTSVQYQIGILLCVYAVKLAAVIDLSHFIYFYLFLVISLKMMAVERMFGCFDRTESGFLSYSSQRCQITL